LPMMSNGVFMVFGGFSVMLRTFMLGHFGRSLSSLLDTNNAAPNIRLFQWCYQNAKASALQQLAPKPARKVRNHLYTLVLSLNECQPSLLASARNNFRNALHFVRNIRRVIQFLTFPQHIRDVILMNCAACAAARSRIYRPIRHRLPPASGSKSVHECKRCKLALRALLNRNECFACSVRWSVLEEASKLGFTKPINARK
jgi:hypothetical protein